MRRFTPALIAFVIGVSALVAQSTQPAAAYSDSDSTGISVSISNGGVSGGTGGSSTVTLHWTNTNQPISDLSGRAGYTGVLWRFAVGSDAFAVHDGVKRSVSVWSW